VLPVFAIVTPPSTRVPGPTSEAVKTGIRSRDFVCSMLPLLEMAAARAGLLASAGPSESSPRGSSSARIAIAIAPASRPFIDVAPASSFPLIVDVSSDAS
jgi:hypothetical protein